MSNCLSISDQTCRVYFPADKINTNKLKGLMATADRSKSYDCMRHHIFWWFITPENVKINEDNSVIISFGMGRSSHTFRDFEQTICVLRDNLILKPHFHTFLCQDEDNDSKWFRWDVDFFNYRSYTEKCEKQKNDFTINEV